jgi:hypothetical protein
MWQRLKIKEMAAMLRPSNSVSYSLMNYAREHL